MIRNRYILTIKDPGTESERFKARWILLGHLDKLRKEISNNSPMLKRMSFRIIISFAAIFFSFLLWTRDVEQAYMQAHKLMRDIFTKAPPEANLSKQYVLKVILPHYGLVESSSCFFDTYYPTFFEKMKMKPAAHDPCLLGKMYDNKLIGMIGLATDDSINTGNEMYQREEEHATKEFITKKKLSFPFRFLGCFIEKRNKAISLVQDLHIQKLEILDPKVINHEKFRSIRGQLLFISQTCRPDICYEVAQLCQVPFGSTTKKDVYRLNEIVHHLHDTAKLTLKYLKLNGNNLKLYVFVDSSYNTNSDNSSQLGLFICLVDKNNQFNLLHWSSTK